MKGKRKLGTGRKKLSLKNNYYVKRICHFSKANFSKTLEKVAAGSSSESFSISFFVKTVERSTDEETKMTTTVPPNQKTKLTSKFQRRFQRSFL